MATNKPNFKELNVFAPAAGRDIVCFNLSGDNLKLAYGRVSPSKIELVDFFNIAILGLSNEDMVQTIKTFLDKHHLKSVEVVNIISTHFAITKDIEIPSKDPQEIRVILELQAGRHTPYSQEEIIIDYLTIGVYKESYTKLIFVIVPLAVVRRQIAVLLQTTAKIERVLFSPETLSHACVRMLNLDEKSPVHTIIHMDAKFTDFLIIAKGRLIYIRSIPIGTQHLSGEAERYQERFIDEIKKSIEVYQNENIDQNAEKYILTGAFKEILPFEEALKQAVNGPISTLPYWDFLPLASGELKNSMSTGKDSYLDMAAAFMAMDKAKVNLIPEEIRLRKTFEKKSQDLVGVGISVLVFLVLICLLMVSKIYFKTAYLKNLTQKYEPSLKKTRELEADFARMKVIKDFLADRNIPLDVLGELYDLIPQDIRFKSVKYGSQGKFSIEGNARSMATVFAFISDMEKSPYFKKVEPKRTAKKTDDKGEIVDFEIVCMLEGLNLKDKAEEPKK